MALQGCMSLIYPQLCFTLQLVVHALQTRHHSCIWETCQSACSEIQGVTGG